MFTNRRKYQRIASHNDECKVVVDGKELKGYLVDESINGAAIAGVDFLMMPMGQPLTIKHRDGQFHANVRNCIRDESQCIMIGVSRSDELRDLPDLQTAMLLNCFVQHQNQLIVCIPIAMKNARTVRVQLFDGMQFDVKRESLLSYTRVERFKQLADSESLSFVADMYGLGTQPINTTKRREVFEFEYGQIKDCPTQTLLSV